jgi:hypothetical protein
MKLRNTLDYWASLEGDPASEILTEPGGPQNVDMDSKIPGSNKTASQDIRVLGWTTKIVTQRIGDKNIVPYMHVYLAFLWCSAHVTDVLQYVQAEMPWKAMSPFSIRWGAPASTNLM